MPTHFMGSPVNPTVHLQSDEGGTIVQTVPHGEIVSLPLADGAGDPPSSMRPPQPTTQEDTTTHAAAIRWKERPRIVLSRRTIGT